MDTNALTNSMKDLIDNLILTKPDDCSDDFQLTLNKLIEKAHDMSSSITLRRVKENEKRRLSATGLDDVRCVTTEIPTIDLDSDSDEEVVQFDGASNDRLAIVTEKQNKNMFDSSSELNKIPKKRCVVRLRRIDVAGCLSPIQGSKDNGSMHSDPVMREKEAVKSSRNLLTRRNTKWYKIPKEA